MMAFLLLFPIASPSCEKAKPENPQIFRLCKYKNNYSADIVGEHPVCGDNFKSFLTGSHF